MGLREPPYENTHLYSTGGRERAYSHPSGIEKSTLRKSTNIYADVALVGTGCLRRFGDFGDFDPGFGCPELGGSRGFIRSGRPGFPASGEPSVVDTAVRTHTHTRRGKTPNKYMKHQELQYVTARLRSR